MKIAILGYGVEGKAIEQYFKNDQIKIFTDFQDSDIPSFHLENFDLVFRSPSVHPQFVMEPSNRGESQDWTTMTKYFLAHCPAPIIGVTGTKGKGTTCAIITSILEEIIKNSEWPTRKVHFIGNIGKPSILELDSIAPDDVVVYEMSSFQLWDVEQSPQVAVVLRIESDHLDRHKDFDDYVNAKSNIARYQTSEDTCIYYRDNELSAKIANLSSGDIYSYPLDNSRYSQDVVDKIEDILKNLQVPGKHIRENAEAAILAVSALLHTPIGQLLNITDFYNSISAGLRNFKSLPHRIQFIRNVNNVDYYDDNYASAFPALDVAVGVFEDRPTVLICGGKDRHLDLSKTKDRIFNAPNIVKVILIGETKGQLAEGQDESKYELADTLQEAVKKAQNVAENITDGQPVVLMSPGAASFDMFKNFEDRGQQYQNIVKEL